MSRPPSFVSALVLVAGATVARAQSLDGGVPRDGETARMEAVGHGDGDGGAPADAVADPAPIVITAPAPAATAPAGPAPLATPAPVILPVAHVGRPPAEALDRPEDVRRAWSRKLLLGATLGVGSPLGLGGLFAEIAPSRYFAVQGGAGFGGSFGPAVALTVLARPWTSGRFALHAALGASVHVTPGVYRTSPYLTAPEFSGWLSPELGVEYRGTYGWGVRFGAGVGVLLNVQDFTEREFMGRTGAMTPPRVGYDPVSVADAASRNEPFVLGFAHFDLLYTLF